MASPQAEHGHTDIANELLDAIIRHDFTKRQYKVLLAVIRKTYGWRKKADDIPSSQLSAMTGLADTHCRAAVRELAELKVLDAQSGRYGQVISLVKDYERWRTKTVRTETVRGEDQNGPAARTKTVREGGPKRSSQKKLSKTTIKSPQGGRERYRYPRARAQAETPIFLSLMPQGGLLEIAAEIRPDLSSPQRVYAKFQAHHNGSRYTPRQWEGKWRLWLLNERETFPGSRATDTAIPRTPGSFLAASRPADLSAEYEVIPNGR